MAQALLISRKDIVKFTAMNGNVDTDKFIQFIKIAQDIHIQNYLGSDLLNKIEADIIASTLTGSYLSLVSDYVKPMLIHWAMVEYLPFAAYTVANGGVYKHISESSESVSKDEVDYLTNKYRDIAQFYTNNFTNFMVYNQDTYPEYNANTEDDFYPDQSGADFGGRAL